MTCARGSIDVNEANYKHAVGVDERVCIASSKAKLTPAGPTSSVIGSSAQAGVTARAHVIAASVQSDEIPLSLPA